MARSSKKKQPAKKAKKATKKLPARKTAKKKTARKSTKKATKKKATKKAGKSGKRTTKSTGPARLADPHPSNLQTQIEVWAAYGRLRSRRRVAAELNVAEWIIRDVLSSDKQRLLDLLDGEMEAMVSRWEDTSDRAHRLVVQLLDIAQGLIAEVHKAMEEGRMTVIRDKDGAPMPILDAMQYVAHIKLLDQVVKLNDRAHQISVAYRSGSPLAAARERAAEAAAGNPAEMDYHQLAAHVRELESYGWNLPEPLRRLLEQAEAS